MREQVVLSVAGLILLTVGCDKLAVRPRAKAAEVTAEQVGEKNIRGQWQGRSIPCLYDGGFFSRADFLYWRADEENLDYADRVNVRLDDPKYSGRTQFPKVEWHPGVRLGVGYTFSKQDYWDVIFLWTHFQSTQKDSVSTHPIVTDPVSGSYLVPTWFKGNAQIIARSGSARWDLVYNVYDADLGRNYFVSKTISVHPSVGLRAATIDQKYHAKYGAASTGTPPPLFPTSMKAQNDFWGIGARIGTELQWRYTSSFSLLGSLGGALLYGDFKVKGHFKTVGSVGTAQNIPLFVDEHLTTGAFNVEAFLGIQWEKFFYQNKMRLLINAGYEWSEWLSQNRFIGYNTVSSFTDYRSGNLTLQGATLQARWDF